MISGGRAALVLRPLVGADFDAAGRAAGRRAFAAVVHAAADAWRRAGLWFVVLFPLITAVVMDSTLYDGIRHLLFIYPVLVVLAVGGWTGLLSLDASLVGPRRRRGRVAVGLVTLLTFDIRFHPNQGVYFNSLVGGPRAAFAPTTWTTGATAYCRRWSGPPRPHGRRVCPSRSRGTQRTWCKIDAARFREVYFTPPQRNRHYFHIRLARGPAASLQELAQEPAVHQVRTPDGAVLCSITPGPAFDEWVALRGPGRITR